MSRTLRNATAVLAFAGAAVSLAVQPAVAHSGYFYKKRSGCVYTGGLSAGHEYAWTGPGRPGRAADRARPG
ncbi:hypothetical protein [Streptomyces sp. NPDC041003]|uniref:hypothetical protein n=1 Tax=Streptomyces sp. NPDC041003 TaxID=3155730 RepID=UPI0034117D26